MRKVFLLALVFPSTLLLSACGSADEPEEETDSPEFQGDSGADRDDRESDEGETQGGEPDSPGPDDEVRGEDGPPPESSAPDPTTCADQEDWKPEWVELEDRILTIVNEHRVAGASCGGEAFEPTEPLVMDEALRCAARLHSKDMAEQDYFSHNSLDGRSPWDRIEAAGFEQSAGGENIAAGSDTAEGTMEQWMGSPGHCSNIMSPGFESIGVGYYPGGEYRHMWTQTFGSAGRR